MSEVLEDLERRVGEKWRAAATARFPQWPTDDPFDLSDWLGELPPLPPGTLQFPRERWASYPAKRTCVLLIADRLLDFDELTDEQWLQLCFLMLYGGKTQIA